MRLHHQILTSICWAPTGFALYGPYGLGALASYRKAFGVSDEAQNLSRGLLDVAILPGLPPSNPNLYLMEVNKNEFS